MPLEIALDYETFFHKKEYSVRGLGNWRYVHDDQFHPYLLTAFDGETEWAGDPKDFNWACLEGSRLLAHNAGFERAVTGGLVEQGAVPECVLANEWQCTANMTSFLADARSLKDAVKVLEGRNISKGIRDDMSGKQWNSLSETEKAAMRRYALGDVRECHGLWTKYSSRWPDFERRLSELTMRQCSRGVRINEELLDQYRVILQEVIFNLERSLPWTERGKKPSSPIAIAEECRKVGIPAPPVKDDDEEGFNTWESTYGPKYLWVYGAGKWRSLNKLLRSLETIKDRIRPDGTIDFSLLYFGAHTGRWSGGGSGLNMQNLRKVPLFIKDNHLIQPPDNLGAKAMADWIAACTDFQLDVRKLFIPRAGKKFILADLSQIEPRVLAWLTGNTALLNLLQGGMSIYEGFARTSMNWTGGKLKSENPEKYNLSKIQVLGLGYGCAWEKFITIAAGYGVTLDKFQSQLIVDTFRQTNQPIVNLWGSLDQEYRASINHDFSMTLPSGRELSYRKVLRQSKMKKNYTTGKFEPRLVYTSEVGGKRIETYGGKLTENLVQAIARDVFGEHMLELEDQAGDVIWTVHDEAITEVELDVTPKDVENIMGRTPAWIEGCPVACEAREAPHYLK